MPETHRNIYAAHGKRQILVADDELVNRELLRMVFEESYEVLLAEDGEQALQAIQENYNTLALVVLDIQMPKKSGLDILRIMREDEQIRNIPVIVATSDQSAEIECLSLGASDFISKPYPQPGVILARVQRTIELREDRDTIRVTERDPLTGLYNREFFFNYAEQFDRHHPDMEMDALVVDINHFRMINERYGRAYADRVLKRIASRFRTMVHDLPGMVCRQEADTFYLYVPHGQNLQEMLDKASQGLAGEESAENRVRLRMGVYQKADRGIDLQLRFDRAKMAADAVRNSFTRTIGFYDYKFHERELYQEQLIEDFHTGIEEHQFQVYLQPKFDVRKETPVLSSAEALVRWIHPTLGMISPGVFIPLFENNGLIQQLDCYVWQEAAVKMREFADRYGWIMPISVNVSRIDMYDPELPQILSGILEKNSIPPESFLLEVTESAYTQESEQIVAMAGKLRDAGFRIEMDDFGTGYSSLGMISKLPLDALKLDMQFVRNAFGETRDTRLIEVIIDIARRLKVPVIAEGVETEDQMLTLKALGCDFVQGYYFSKPVPMDEFEIFLKQKEVQEAEQKEMEKPTEPVQEEAPPEEEQLMEKRQGGMRFQEKGTSLRALNIIFAIAAVLAATLLFISDFLVNRGYHRMDESTKRYISAKEAARDLEDGSDTLTECVRDYVVSHNIANMEGFFEEANVIRRRDRAVETLRELLVDSENAALDSLSKALACSNELMELEYHAMKLCASIENASGLPSEVENYVLSDEEQKMSPEEKQAAAMELVFGEEYQSYKARIRSYAEKCSEHLITESETKFEKASGRMPLILSLQGIMTIIMLLVVLVLVLYVSYGIRKPLTRMVELMRNDQTVPVTGAQEIRYVSRTYNEILLENQKTNIQLTYEASHDKLTGLYNRRAYDMFMQKVDGAHIALLIVDVDYFKSFNDTYGHDMGDRVLVRVAELLNHSFRSVDIICRIGGDEFAVIMTRANSSMSELVKNKIRHANALLQNPEDGLPKVSLSVGVAFSDRKNPQGDIFKDADTALYRVKNAGRCGCEVYE